MSESLYIGIDVAKAQLDVACRPTSARWTVPHTTSGIGRLVRRLRRVRPALIVLEATGGLELALVEQDSRRWRRASGWGPDSSVVLDGQRAHKEEGSYFAVSFASCFRQNGQEAGGLSAMKRRQQAGHSQTNVARGGVVGLAEALEDSGFIMIASPPMLRYRRRLVPILLLSEPVA